MQTFIVVRHYRQKNEYQRFYVLLLHAQRESEDPRIHLNFKSIFAFCKKSVNCLTVICSTLRALVGYASHLLCLCGRVAVISVLSTQ